MYGRNKNADRSACLILHCCFKVCAAVTSEGQPLTKEMYGLSAETVRGTQVFGLPRREKIKHCCRLSALISRRRSFAPSDPGNVQCVCHGEHDSDRRERDHDNRSVFPDKLPEFRSGLRRTLLPLLRGGAMCDQPGIFGGGAVRPFRWLGTEYAGCRLLTRRPGGLFLRVQGIGAERIRRRSREKCAEFSADDSKTEQRAENQGKEYIQGRACRCGTGNAGSCFHDQYTSRDVRKAPVCPVKNVTCGVFSGRKKRMRVSSAPVGLWLTGVIIIEDRRGKVKPGYVTKRRSNFIFS